jgi:FkbM family methyltransferase
LLTPKCGAAALIYYQGASEPETASYIERTLKPGMVFVDVGAHLGEYTVLAAKLVGRQGVVHAFEPNPNIVPVLTENLRINNCHNVRVYPFAVGDREGPCKFEVTLEPSTCALRPSGKTICGSTLIEVPVVTLDAVYGNGSMVVPSLIKIDVEGAELCVLRGAKSLLALPAPRAPILIFEYAAENTANFGYSPDEITQFLRELRYSVYEWKGGNTVPLEACPNLPQTGLSCNLLAVKLRDSLPLPAAHLDQQRKS